MRAIEHTRPVPQGHRIGQFFLAGLLDHPVELAERADGFLETDRIADLDGAGQGLLRLDGFEGLEVTEIGPVQRVGALRLRHDNSRQAGDQAQVFHQQQPFAQGRDIPEVPAGNDNHIRRFPIELLDDFDAHGLLSLHP